MSSTYGSPSSLVKPHLGPHPSPFHSLLLLTIPVPAAVALQAELLMTLLMGCISLYKQGFLIGPPQAHAHH